MNRFGIFTAAKSMRNVSYVVQTTLGNDLYRFLSSSLIKDLESVTLF